MIRGRWYVMIFAVMGVAGFVWEDARGAAEPRSAYYYTYFDQPVELGIDQTRIAVHAPNGINEQDLSKLGLSASDMEPGAIAGWSIATMPAMLRDETAVEALVPELTLANGVEFVSPVLIDQQGDPIIVTRDLLIGFHHDVSREQAEMVLQTEVSGFVLDRDWAGMPGVYRVQTTYADGLEVLDLANRLAQLPEVRFAESDMIMTTRPALIPNDPLFNSLWGLRQGNGHDMDADLAWEVTTGDPDIIVVILDDGVQQNHPDINQIAGADFTGNNTGGGPYNYCDNHGTAVAGCTSAIINNNLGVVGVAPNCKVASAKWSVANTPCNGSGTFQVSWLVSAINWAQAIGARVTNNSNTMGASSSITSKYNQTYANGVVHFAASGNEGSSSIPYPASIGSVNAVGAMTPSGSRWFWSNYGSGMRCMAPGVDVRTTDRTGSAGYAGGDYTWTDGTSFASPYAAGVCALLFAVNPVLTAGEAEQILFDTAEDYGPSGYDTQYGYGFVNAYNAVVAVGGAPDPPGNFALLAPSNGASDVEAAAVTFDWSPSDDADTYTLVVDDDQNFYNPEIEVSGLEATSYTALDVLVEGRTYFWQVTAHNAIGTATSSPSVAVFLTITDCNGNGIDDATEISQGSADDCNENGRPDSCDLIGGYAYESLDLTPFGFDSPQSVTLTNVPQANGEVLLIVRAYGDFNFTTEFVDVELNGVNTGSVLVTSSDCTERVDELPIPAANYNAALGTGTEATFTFIASESVDSQLCDPVTWISLELAYDGAPLDTDTNGNGTLDSCETLAVVGDLNCDGTVNNFDIDPFVLALTDPAGYNSSQPDCDINLGDINGDGAVNNFDIDPFVALLTGG